MLLPALPLAAAIVAQAAPASGDARRSRTGRMRYGLCSDHLRADVEPVPNYGVIWNKKLTRSGQPPTPEGWTWLRKQGVRSVVGFRSERDADCPSFGFERCLWLPLKASEPPEEADVERFLAFVKDPQHWPVHIYCKKGEDRTGVMAALVRYAIDGWPLERALAEARSYRGGGSDLAPPIVVWLRQWAAGHEPGSHRPSLQAPGMSAEPPPGAYPSQALR